MNSCPLLPLLNLFLLLYQVLLECLYHSMSSIWAKKTREIRHLIDLLSLYAIQSNEEETEGLGQFLYTIFIINKSIVTSLKGLFAKFRI